MPRLYLLRHAEALPAQPGQADAARELSPYGHEQTQRLKAWFAERAITRVVASPATRTQMTAKASFPDRDILTDARIYEAVPGTLMAVINDHLDADTEALVLVGHNPGFSDVAAMLATDHTHPAVLSGMATGSVIVFERRPEQTAAPYELRVLQRFDP